MNRLSFLVAAVALLCLAACATGPGTLDDGEEGQIKGFKPLAGTVRPGVKRIAVIDVKNVSTQGGTDLERVAQDHIQKWMELHPMFQYISEAQLEPKEPLRDEKGDFSLENAMAAARAQGVAALLIGTVEEIELEESGDDTGFFRTRTLTTRGRVKLKVYDVNTRKEIFTRNEVGRHSTDSTRLLAADATALYSHEAGKSVVIEALDKILNELPKYARRIDWVGRVSKVESPRIYLDSGRLSGLEKGQLLRVFGPLAPVTDAETTKEIGSARGRYKGTIRVIDFFGEDGAIAMLHSGSGFLEKDRVELHIPRHQ